MLIKIRNTDDGWEIWDGVAHVGVQRLMIDFKEGDGESYPDGFSLHACCGPIGVAIRPIESPPDVVVIDMRREAYDKEGQQFGRFLEATMRDGSTKTFAFATEGYLVSDEGSTLESWNRH